MAVEHAIDPGRSVEVGTVSKMVAERNGRSQIIFSNDSANPIYLRLAPDAKCGEGIRLDETLLKLEYAGEVHAVSTGEGSILCVVEL